MPYRSPICLCARECVVEVFDDVLSGFEPDRYSNHSFGHSRVRALFGRAVVEDRTRRVDDQRLRIAEIRSPDRELECVHETKRLIAIFQTERYQLSTAPGEERSLALVVRVTLQPRIADR